MKLTAALLVAVLGGLPGEASAQPSEQTAPVDAAKIVSLDRIRRELGRAEAREQEPGTVNLRFHVDVFGQAPTLDFFSGFPLDVGPVPYGGPTHGDVLDFLTPQGFSSPAQGAGFAAVGKLAAWAVQKLYARHKKARCDRELEEYKALVMQGVSVAAPRCAQ